GHDVAGGAEDIDHVDGAADLGERSDEGPAEQALPDMTGVDRDHVIAALHEILEGEVARAHLDRRGADHRDRLHAVEDLADVVIRVAVVIHAGRSFHCKHEALSFAVIPGRCEASNPESRDSPMRNCASEVWSFGPSRNDGVLAASLLDDPRITHPAISARA